VSKEARTEETLSAPGRRLSKSGMRENRSAELMAKPHVRFEATIDETQDMNDLQAVYLIRS